MTACPACLDNTTDVIRTYAVTEASNYFVPPLRDPERNRRLQYVLRDLWGSDRVAVRSCRRCGFYFADPFVAGSADIYNLITEGNEHYPSDRFEYGETIKSLAMRKPQRLLEIGAGHGAFLRQARAAGVVSDTFTTEYDNGAVARLGQIPRNTTFQGSVQEFAATEPDPFEVICLFQVLEHLDDLDAVFAALAQICVPGGDLFIGVPNDARTAMQERVTEFWDMPPNHIGRWTYKALAAVAGRAGFKVIAQRFEPAPLARGVWSLAKYRWEARAADPSSLGARVNGIRDRRIRGVLKRGLAAQDFVVLARFAGKVPPHAQWFHATRSHA